jgi:hypothetical protein
MMQPLLCSSASPYGIHLAIRDNVCARCGWTAPRFAGTPSITVIENDGGGGSTFDREEDGGRAP